ncbi:MAG TPA: haloacid dehalogenase type II, partial [Dehalococcoidia bacterium]|nr:haloacid dehalogenase type II [Dehalococcoidia bacterium]
MPDPIDLSQIRALTWDIGGTVFDWHHSIKDEVSALAANRGAELDAALFANTWRRRMFQELQRVRSGELPWM